MSDRKHAKDTSGWYARTRMTKEERTQIDAWYDTRITLNYKTIPVEAPGKMVLALGELAQQHGMAGPRFSEFIEGILDEYLQRQGIDWRKRA
jgi:hypothetical protein